MAGRGEECVVSSMGGGPPFELHVGREGVTDCCSVFEVVGKGGFCSIEVERGGGEKEREAAAAVEESSARARENLSSDPRF